MFGPVVNRDGFLEHSVLGILADLLDSGSTEVLIHPDGNKLVIRVYYPREFFVAKIEELNVIFCVSRRPPMLVKPQNCENLVQHGEDVF